MACHPYGCILVLAVSLSLLQLLDPLSHLLPRFRIFFDSLLHLRPTSPSSLNSPCFRDAVFGRHCTFSQVSISPISCHPHLHWHIKLLRCSHRPKKKSSLWPLLLFLFPFLLNPSAVYALSGNNLVLVHESPDNPSQQQHYVQRIVQNCADAILPSNIEGNPTVVDDLISKCAHCFLDDTSSIPFVVEIGAT